GSLRDEIAVAKSGDTITFDVNKVGSPIIYLTTGELSISKNLTIKGPGAGVLAIEPYFAGGLGSSSRIFEVDGAGTTVAISGLTLGDGGGLVNGDLPGYYPYDGYGGAVLNLGTLSISNCTLGGSLSGNYAQSAGGAVANFGTMSVTSCDV